MTLEIGISEERTITRIAPNPSHDIVVGVRISPVQFLHNRELGIRDEKHEIVIKDPVSDWSLFARQKVYSRLRDDEYEKRH